LFLFIVRDQCRHLPADRASFGEWTPEGIHYVLK